MAFTLHDLEMSDSLDDTFTRLRSPDFDYVHHGLVAAPFDSKEMAEASGRDAVRVVDHGANRVSLEADMASSGVVVLADVFFSGWKVFADDTEVDLLRIDGALLGAFVPQGAHIIRFEYWPASFVTGASVSLLSLLVLGLWGGATPARRHRARWTPGESG